jgi:hypothetical protein
MYLIEHVFSILDKNEDSKISIDDFKGIFIAKFHPKFVNGEWNEIQVFVDYLTGFDVDHYNNRQVESLQKSVLFHYLTHFFLI